MVSGAPPLHCLAWTESPRRRRMRLQIWLAPPGNRHIGGTFMSAPFGWFYSVAGETLHYFQWGKSLCGRVTKGSRLEPREDHPDARVCQRCATRAKDKPQKVDPDEARLFS